MEISVDLKEINGGESYEGGDEGSWGLKLGEEELCHEYVGLKGSFQLLSTEVWRPGEEWLYVLQMLFSSDCCLFLTLLIRIYVICINIYLQNFLLFISSIFFFMTSFFMTLRYIYTSECLPYSKILTFF